MNQWLVEARTHLFVASIQKGSVTANSALSFQIVNADCLAIANAIDKVKRMRDSPEEYLNTVNINCGNVDLYKFSGPTCSIVVNHCRVVYHGDIDRLNGLPDKIRKSYAKFEKEI
jgi:hypothetical protein